jgi:hypothetical protein
MRASEYLYAGECMKSTAYLDAGECRILICRGMHEVYYIPVCIGMGLSKNLQSVQVNPFVYVLHVPELLFLM